MLSLDTPAAGDRVEREIRRYDRSVGRALRGYSLGARAIPSPAGSTVWRGGCAVLGLPVAGGPADVPMKIATLLLNILIVTAASLGTYVLLNAAGPAMKRSI